MDVLPLSEIDSEADSEAEPLSEEEEAGSPPHAARERTTAKRSKRAHSRFMFVLLSKLIFAN
jgi:hypothetical protein